jgi:hypothetical protein
MRTKFIKPDVNCTWLLTKLSPKGIGFGLCDLGHGFPEMGYVDLAELQAIREKLRLLVERDKGFVADKTLPQYAQLTRREERINA